MYPSRPSLKESPRRTSCAVALYPACDNIEWNGQMLRSIGRTHSILCRENAVLSVSGPGDGFSVIGSSSYDLFCPAFFEKDYI